MAATGLGRSLVGTAWQLLSVVILAFFYKGSAMVAMDMMIEAVINPRHHLMFFAYLCAGGVLAALVFALSVVSVPLLVDRRCDLICALATSIDAVAENPLPLAFWAFIIMLLCGLGFATALFGLMLVLPWLGHASLDAYRDLVENEAFAVAGCQLHMPAPDGDGIPRGYRRQAPQRQAIDNRRLTGVLRPQTTP